MSYPDAVISQFVWYVVIPSLSVVATVYFLLNHLKSVREKIFSIVYGQVSEAHLKSIEEGKIKLFEDIHQMKSVDRELKNQGILRILEVGTGPGTNFKYFPRNAKVIAVEPNKYFTDELIKNAQTYRHIEIEKLVTAKGEDMAEIQNSSVDVVVITMVLCSVTNVDACFREAFRVLAPGGKLYFFEHGYGRRKSWQFWLQTLLNPVWKLFFGGCNLNRDVVTNLYKLRLFKNIQIHEFQPKKLMVGIDMCLGSHVYGTAQKPVLFVD